MDTGAATGMGAPTDRAAVLARRHAAAFARDAPWSETAFAGLLGLPGVFLCDTPEGFALGRVVLDEAELLTLAVAPEHRRAGAGRALLAAFEAAAAARGATTAFLEVAADNAPALALYVGAGWRQGGRRQGYYRRADGRAADALLLSRALVRDDPAIVAGGAKSG